MTITPSKASRQRFGELCVNYEVLRTIHQLFNAYDFENDDSYNGPESGERRWLVASYHATIDYSDPAQVARLVNVYVDALDRWTMTMSPEWPVDIRAFIRGLQRDGVPIDDGGRLTSGGVTMLAADRIVLEDPRVLSDHLRRIGDNVDQDPALTIGAAKELVETICRVILHDVGVEPAKEASLKDLYKAAAAPLGLNREAVPGDAAASQAARNALQALSNVVGSLAEMRNAMGTGHGKAHRSAALGRHGRLAAHSAQGLGGFLLETWQERRAAGRWPPNA
jgi:hypothetical protein